MAQARLIKAYYKFRISNECLYFALQSVKDPREFEESKDLVREIGEKKSGGTIEEKTSSEKNAVSAEVLSNITDPNFDPIKQVQIHRGTKLAQQNCIESREQSDPTLPNKE